MPEARASETIGGSGVQHVDIAVVGAGFAGLYLLHRLRQRLHGQKLSASACAIPGSPTS